MDDLIFELNAQTIAQNLRVQIISKLSILTAAISNQTDSDDEAAAKDREIREINDRKEVDGWNHVSKFYKINKLHPKPWVLVPKSGPKDLFVMITETAIIRNMDPEMLERATGISMDNWLTDNQGRGIKEPQGSFLKFLFGDALGGDFKCADTKQYMERNPNPDFSAEKKNIARYLLKTAFKTDGFSVQCIVFDTCSKKIKVFKSSNVDPVAGSKFKPRRSKEPQTALPPQNEINGFKNIIGVDFGEKYAGGFVCNNFKDYHGKKDGSMAYEVKENGSMANENTLNDNVNDLGSKKSCSTINNLKIKTAALSEPIRLFRNFLEHAKNAVSYVRRFNYF